MHVFNLPMISRPRLWTKDNIGGDIKVEIIALVYPEQTVVRYNPNIMKRSQISDSQINCINYMNQIPYTVNTGVFNLLMSEWSNENSLLFKGLNKEHPNTKDIGSISKKSKQYT